jgi:hypothetical protein
VRLALRSTAPDATAVLALYGRATVLRAVQLQPPPRPVGIAPVAAFAGVPPRPQVLVGDVEETLAATLTARGGQSVRLRMRTGDRYGLGLSCTGTTSAVTVRLIVDGRPTMGDLQGPDSCSTSTGANGLSGPPVVGEHVVELQVVGPEAALVTAAVYGAAPEAP